MGKSLKTIIVTLDQNVQHISRMCKMVNGHIKENKGSDFLLA